MNCRLRPRRVPLPHPQPRQRVGELLLRVPARGSRPPTPPLPPPGWRPPRPRPGRKPPRPLLLRESLLPGAELTVREAGSVRAVGLLEKLQKEYAGVEVDPAADPAEVQTGRLDQLPNATHSRLTSAATELKHFAEGMLRKLSAAAHSLVVSIFNFLLGRASAPTGCSPRDSG